MIKNDRYTFPVNPKVVAPVTFPQPPIGGIVPSTTGEDHGAKVVKRRDDTVPQKRYGESK